MCARWAASRARSQAASQIAREVTAAHLAHSCDGARRADYVGIAQLAAAAASSAALLVRSNLVVSDKDWQLGAASAAAAEASRVAQRAAADDF